MQLHIKKFDPSSITDDKVIILLGKRNTGKTFLLKDILYYHRDIPIGTVICPTESANSAYGAIIPSLFIHEEYTPDLINNVVTRQKLMPKRIDKEKALYGKSSIDPRAFLILDDCLYDGCWKRDENIKYIFTKKDQHNIFLAITMGFPVGISQDLMSNVDFIFIFCENNLGNRRRIYESYASIFSTFEEFCDTLTQLTNNYKCLVIDNCSKSNKLEERIFWYEAEEHPQFTIGSKEFWITQNENTDDEQEDELFNIETFREKSVNSSITVKKRKLHY